MSRYAQNTDVSSEKSKAEIERTLTRYGADQFMYGWVAGSAMIAFRINGLHVRFRLPMPDRESFRYTETRGFERSRAAWDATYEQAVRQRWRALALVIKAKLEAVEAGITTVEDEFLSATMLPDGSTVGEWATDQVRAAYTSGVMPELIPGTRPALPNGRKLARP